MALKKPSDFFNKENQNIDVQIIEPDIVLREELDKVENLSEQVVKLQQELTQKVIKNDLESLVLSQINLMQENFEYLQNDFKKSNKKDIAEFRDKVSEITEIVGNLVEKEFPKYKKQIINNEVKIGDKFDTFKEIVEKNIVDIKEEVDITLEGLVNEVDGNLQHFNSHLQETQKEVKKTTDTYNKLSKIVENKILKENEKLEEYSQTIKSFYEEFIKLELSLQEKNSTHFKVIEEKFEIISSDIKNKIENIDESAKDFENKISSEIINIKTDVVINEQHIKNVDKYLQKNHQELIALREEVFTEIKQIPVGNIQENIEQLEKKIDFIRETYSKIEPEVIVKEVIQEGLLNEPSETKNSDPLTPLNQNFVTLDQLQGHYRLFVNRIQQQIASIGGGGEYRFRFLDGIVGIKTNPDAYDGKYLQWNSATNKAEFVAVSGGGGSQTLNQTLGLGNTSSLGMSVGIITTTSINFASGGLLGDPYGDGGTGLKASATGSQYATIASNNLQQYIQVDDNQIFIGTGYASTTGSYDWKFDKNGALTFPDNTLQSTAFIGIATYASTAGIATYASTAGVSTYATRAGIATYATSSGIATYSATSGIATYANSSGVSTYASTAGIATIAGYATTAGISTVAQNLTGSPNITVSSVNSSGVITASSFNGSGANLTSLNASNISSGTVPSFAITSSFGNFTVGQNLYVNGSLSVGGTSIILNAASLQIADRDIVLGITTNGLNQDISTDNTANHGGIAIASTEGSPLINIPLQVGVNSNPSTYKQLMWIKQGNYSGMGTDAWVSNYAVSIGNTETVQTGSRLTVGAGFTVFDTYLDATDIKARNINATGIITASSFSGNASSATYATSSGIATYATSSGIATYATTAGIATNATYATTAGIATFVLTNPGVGIQTSAGLVGTGATILDFRGSGISTVTVTSGIATINIIGPDISPVMMSMIF